MQATKYGISNTPIKDITSMLLFDDSSKIAFLLKSKNPKVKKYPTATRINGLNKSSPKFVTNVGVSPSFFKSEKGMNARPNKKMLTISEIYATYVSNAFSAILAICDANTSSPLFPPAKKHKIDKTSTITPPIRIKKNFKISKYFF